MKRSKVRLDKRDVTEAQARRSQEMEARLAESEAEFKRQLAQAKIEKDRAIDAWHEESNRALTAMSGQLEAAKLKKQLSIVAHITAGRANEAIQELLDPMVLEVTCNVIMDDKSHDAANKEMLKQVVEKVTSFLAELRLAPNDK